MADVSTIVVSIPFAGGVDEQTAKQYLDPNTRMVSIVNGLIYKEGAVDKRQGLKHVANLGESGISTAIRLTPWTKGPLTLVGLKGGGVSGVPQRADLYGFSQVQGDLQAVSELPNVAVKRTPVITNPSPEAPWILDIPVKIARDTRTGVTLRMTLFRELPSLDLYATVVDLQTEQVYLQKTLVYANTGTVGIGSAPYPIAMFTPVFAAPGEDVCITVQDNAGLNRAFLINYDYTSNTFSSPVFLFNCAGNGALGICDVAPFMGNPDGNFIAMSCQTPFGTEAHVSVFSSTGTLVSDQVLLNEPGERFSLAFAIEGTWGDKCHFFFATIDGFNFYRQRYFQTAGDDALTPDFGGSSTLYQDSFTQEWPSGCCRIASGQTFVHVTHGVVPSADSAISTQAGTWSNVSNVQTVLGVGYAPFGFVPVAKPFVHEGSVYEANYFELIVTNGVGSGTDRSEQITLYLNRYGKLDQFNVTLPLNDYVFPVACSSPRQVDDGAGNLLVFNQQKKPFMSQTELRGPFARQRFGFGLRTRGSGTPAIVNRLGPSWCTDFSFNEEVDSPLNGQYQPTELLGELGVSGGVQFVADGLQANEDSFFYYPEFSYAGLGDFNPEQLVGQYIYAVCYSYVDAAGLVHRSSPSFTNPVTALSSEDSPPFGKAPQVHVPVMSASWRDVANPGQVWAEVYRTESNGSVFYFLDRVQVSGLFPTTYEVVWPLDFPNVDETPDDVLISASLLYTTGNGELDNVNPPASGLSCVHKDRRAIVDETGQNVWFTKEANSAVLAPGWNEALIVPFPEGGDIVGVASMDGTFIVFKRNSIWKLYGSGPPNNGSSSDWTIPEAIVTDVGAVSWNSIVETPDGFVFQAETGFHLLTRSLTVQYIGQDVQDRFAAYPTVVSATLVTTNSNKHVRWTVMNAVGSETTVIVWDYEHKTWFFYEYEQLGDLIQDTAVTDVYASPNARPVNAYTVMNRAGELWTENSRATADSSYKDQDSAGLYHFVTTTLTTAPIKLGVQAAQRARLVQFYGERLDPCGLKMELMVNYKDDVVQTGTWISPVLDRLDMTGQVQMGVAAKLTRQQALSVRFYDTEAPVHLTGQGMRFVNVSVELENVNARWRQISPLGRR